jgi:hypothetical protein
VGRKPVGVPTGIAQGNSAVFFAVMFGKPLEFNGINPRRGEQ